MTALQNRRTAKGRHPLLKVGTLAQRIFNHLKAVAPGTTIREIASALHEERQSVNGMLQRMKREGLILTQHVQRGGRAVIGYFVVMENESGFARDKIMIETKIFVNDFGEYSATSKVVNEVPGARMSAGLKEMCTVHYSAAVPKPTEPYKTRVVFDPRDLGFSLIENDPLVIEGEIVDIKDK